MAIGRPIELTPNVTQKNISVACTEGQTEFTVTDGYRINEIAVYRNGVRLVDGRDFSATDGQTVTFISDTVVADDIVEFSVFDSFDVAGVIVSAASTQTLSGNLHVTGELYAGDFKPTNIVATAITSSSAFHVGSALTANAAGDVETIGIITANNLTVDRTTSLNNVTAGVVTATSFNGDGSALTNVGMDTANVVSTATTTTLLNVPGTTDSTSSTTGSVTIAGGVGIAKNVYIGAGLSVAGTLTYEDVTSVDSVGLITAKSGVNITGGELTVGSGITMGIAGVATFSGTSDVHLRDNVQLNVGDGSDLKIYHDATTNIIDTASANLEIRHGAEKLAAFAQDGQAELWFDNSKKFETSNDGTVTTGIATATLGIDAAISVWTLGADGSSHYTFTGPGNLSATNDPTLNLKRGQKYTFKNRSGGHPFRIQSTPNGSAGTAYNTGVTNNDGGDGTNILFDVPHNAPNVLYYQCTSHGNMGGAMYIDGSAYEISVGAGITFGSAGVSTFSGTADVHLLDNVQLNVGDGSDLAIYHDGTSSYIKNTTNDLVIWDDSRVRVRTPSLMVNNAADDENLLVATADGSVDLYYNNSKKIETTNDGTVTTGIATVTQGLNTDGLLSEKFETTAGKLSDNTNIDLEDGMVHYFSTQETTTSTPNIRYSSSKSLNNMLSVGDAITVTIITTAAAAGYSANMTIDGGAQTEEWVGGDAPSEGGSDGLDILTFNILKTASATFKVIGNYVNASN